MPAEDEDDVGIAHAASISVIVILEQCGKGGWKRGATPQEVSDSRNANIFEGASWCNSEFHTTEGRQDACEYEYGSKPLCS
jgi:hypothetical protein